MNWLTSDLNLVESDAEQLRRHLGWLAEDLRAHQLGAVAPPGEAGELAEQADDWLERLAHLEVLISRVRRAAS